MPFARSFTPKLKAILKACLGRDPQAEYWRSRARAFGKRSVLHLGHPEEDFDRVTEAQKAEIFPFLKAALDGSERIALDYGCGPGRFTRDLAALTRGSAVGVDLVPEFFDLAPKDAAVRFDLIRNGVIPLPEAYVDLVWVCLVLGGIQGRALVKTVAEIGRVLRPGGLLFLVENTSELPDAEHWHYRPVSAYQKLFPFAKLTHVHDYYDLSERISILAGRKGPGGAAEGGSPSL